MKRKFFYSLALLMLGLPVLFAQEGMWLLTQIDQLDLKDKGLEIPVEKIYSPEKTSLSQAILQLDGGSSSFVSPKGLVVTNHHVAFTAIQRSSSVDNNYIKEGFLAKDLSEEIQAPGYEARMMIGLKDVTEEVLTAVEGITDPMARDKGIMNKIDEITDAINSEEGDHEAIVAEMYNGKQYIMYTYKVFKDIRLVYVPPSSIGNYGGDIDNWMWPRHTGDFSFVRVYVDEKGEGVAYSEDNVPYEPKIWLKVGTGDLDEGDFNFIMGFPGFTTRYRTSLSVDWNLNNSYPFIISKFREIIDLATALTAEDPEGRIKVANLLQGLANTEKNFQGKVEGMQHTHFLESKRAFEKDFQAWTEENPERKAKYGSILPRIQEQYDKIEQTKQRDQLFQIYGLVAGTMASVANRIYSLSKELEKPEDERQPGLNEARLEALKQRMNFIYNDYYEPLDRALLTGMFRMADELPDNLRIRELDEMLAASGKTAEEWVEDAYANSKLKDLEYAQSLVGKSSSELEATNDPFIMLAAAIYPVAEEVNKSNEEFNAQVTPLRKEYMDALYEWKGSTMYPDANSTIRFTWGPVKGYSPRDAVLYEPFTTLQGVVEKNTGEEPFNAPAALLALHDKKDYGRWADPDLGDVPVAFLNQCDITGGNSGSPVLNAKGEIVGIAFDGNYEAMISDWQYDYTLQRTIAVDMRYVLFVTEKFGGAAYLLEEMEIAE